MIVKLNTIDKKILLDRACKCMDNYERLEEIGYFLNDVYASYISEYDSDILLAMVDKLKEVVLIVYNRTLEFAKVKEEKEDENGEEKEDNKKEKEEWRNE